MNCYYPPKHFANYFRFAFVRDPLDRLASCWRNRVLDQNYFHLSGDQRQSMSNFNSFIDWVQTKDLETCDVHLRLQCRLIDLNHVDFIGRFENFDNDFRVVAAHIGLPVVDIPHENRSSSSTSADLYSYETRKRVTDLYAKDVAIFGYTGRL
ncbi:sulfotransferase family 2 domain-containing protein [Methyloceanibacter marginalis]|uniref:sulfotransferase family 2 domain-containing protein n=1 Tax=Methyloceanibacter marginalis TaxID=1774971 RepID=UPI00195A727C|nr:sulfotransferase family 2 domain-containing protein [Methyloceanibacter marginalis]